MDLDHREIANIVQRARLVIDNYGWTQRAYGNTDGQVCCIGALIQSFDNNTPDYRAVKLNVEQTNMAIIAVGEQLHGNLNDRYAAPDDANVWYHHDLISEWNDEPERSKQDIIDLLEQTIAYERELGGA